jgi:hypothetical protein
VQRSAAHEHDEIENAMNVIEEAAQNLGLHSSGALAAAGDALDA